MYQEQEQERESYADYARQQEAEYQRIKALPSANQVDKEVKVDELNALIAREECILSRLGEPGSALLVNANNLLRRLDRPVSAASSNASAIFGAPQALFHHMNAESLNAESPPTTPRAAPRVAVVTP